MANRFFKRPDGHYQLNLGPSGIAEMFVEYTAAELSHMGVADPDSIIGRTPDADIKIVEKYPGEGVDEARFTVDGVSLNAMVEYGIAKARPEEAVGEMAERLSIDEENFLR